MQKESRLRLDPHRDYLQAYWTQAPLALSVVRASECHALSRLEFEQPMLDLGCGDGLLAQILFGSGVNVGLDLSRRALLSAARRRAYATLAQGDVSRLPFQKGVFATVFSNCVMEHLADLPGGLREITRVLQVGGRLIITVPTTTTQRYLGGAALLRALALPGASRRYEDWYNRLSTQRNLHTVEQWRALMAEAGLELTEHHVYGSSRVVACHDLLTPLGLPHLALKRLTGRYVLCPAWRRRLAPGVAALARKVLLKQPSAQADEAEGRALLLVATKVSDT